jgi:hypothetical protein
MAYYLALISPTDSPIYEAHLNSSKPHNQIISSSTSTFPSWSSFPAFGHRDNPSSTTVNPQSSFNAPQVPAKDPFPPQLLGGTGTTSLSVPASSATTNRPQGVEKHVLQMIAFSSLDIIEDVMQGTGSLYLKNVDRFNEWNVSALAVPCGEFSFRIQVFDIIEILYISFD